MLPRTVEILPTVRADTAAEATRRVEAEFKERADGQLEADPETDPAS